MKTYKAAFVGTGMIGAGLAANAALNNFDVTLYDVVDRDKMKSNLTHIMDILVEAEAITQEEADAALADVRYTNDLEDAVRGADFVQECIPERLQLKQDTYRTIQNVTGPDTVIASSKQTAGGRYVSGFHRRWTSVQPVLSASADRDLWWRRCRSDHYGKSKRNLRSNGKSSDYL